MLWPPHPLESRVSAAQADNWKTCLSRGSGNWRREKRGRGGWGRGGPTFLPAGHCHPRVLPMAGTFLQELQGSGGLLWHSGTLALSKLPWSTVELETSPCWRSNIHSAGGDSLSITISKILGFLKLLLQSSVSPTWDTVEGDCGSGLVLNAEERATQPYFCAATNCLFHVHM